MAHREAWITVAVDDDAALNALILAESLKRTKTTRKLIVIVGTSVSESFQGMLSEGFDAVILTNSRNGAKNIFDDSVFGHVLCLSVPLLRKCIYLNCNVVVFRNADHLFESDIDEGVANLLPNKAGIGIQQPSLVLYIPSEKSFQSAIAYLNSDENNLNNWFLGKGMTLGFDEFCCSISPNSNTVIVTNPKKLSFVHFEKQKKNIGNCDNSLDDPFKKEAYAYLEELRRAVNPTEKALKRTSFASDDHSDPIAIVGMACRFAGCSNKEEYWDMLMAKKAAVRNVSENRWPKERFPDMDPSCMTAKASFLDSIDEFDGKFFGMSPYELEYADPQQRMMLEVLWEALEDAAINPHSLSDTNTGIFTGTWMQEYKEELSKRSSNDFFRGYMGNSFGASAGRLSHFLGITGPNIATESGCSSSLVAVGIGINKLRNRTTDLALCCGVNLLTNPFDPAKFSITSPHGFSKTFDANADGFGRGEGCGVLVLKRLSDAVRDGDRVYALIQGYGEAQEGPSASLGTPTVAVESQAMELALKDAGIKPWEVSYVEAHGTGTQVGDPLEFSAITRVYSSPKRVEPLVVASVKPNIGHTESCSGIAAIIKTVLALVHEKIPPHIGCTELNPRIDLNALPAIIPMDSVTWKRQVGAPRKAGVSNFGITGTDAHLILEEAPEGSNLPKMLSLPNLSLQLLTLSAKSEEALNALIDSYQKYLQGCPPTTSLSDVTFTANTGRAALSPWRAAVIGKDCGDILNKIEKQGFTSGSALLPGGGCPKIVMTFSGQGNYYFGMGQGLYETFPIFRQHMDYCFILLKEAMGIDFKTLMWVDDPTGVLQVNHSLASLSVQYSTFKLWESWGVKPDIVLGHSVGEFVAAIAAGFLTIETAFKLAVARQDNVSTAKGKMLAIAADIEMVKRLKKEVESTGEENWLDYCCFNAPSQIVLGGRDGAIAKLEDICKNNAVKSTIINPVLALHTRALNQALVDFRQHLEVSTAIHN